jgi:hypothetical protein
MVKVKELKDDATLEITVNKNYYLMAKAASLTIIQSLNIGEKGDEYFKETITKNYQDLDPMQRAFYTIVLLLSEIEKTATEKNLYVEKEILEAGDEGYIEPKTN